ASTAWPRYDTLAYSIIGRRRTGIAHRIDRGAPQIAVLPRQPTMSGNSCCSASLNGVSAAGRRMGPYTARREGCPALISRRAIEPGVANGCRERDICMGERVGGLCAIQDAERGTAAEGFWRDGAPGSRARADAGGALAAIGQGARAADANSCFAEGANGGADRWRMRAGAGRF